jgi:Cd2+/Zn2+-exporting ATPase
MTTCTVCEVHAESVFRVEGMDCHEEVTILEHRLKRLAGLEALHADVLGGRLSIKYDAARLTTSHIAEAVAQTGMRAWLEHEEARPAPDAHAWRDRLVWGSAALTAAGFLMELTGSAGRVPTALFGIAIAAGGAHTARRAWVSLRAGSLDIYVLMLVAVAGAIALGEWSEGASVVVLFALAQSLESRAMERARGAIRALMDLAPQTALLKRDGVESLVPVEDVRVGDVVIVRPGEKIPLDGRVTAGTSYVNQAPVTGESLPVEKEAGAEVFGGTINGRGALEVAATRLRADSTIARIIHLVERAQAQRAPSHAFVDRFARIYTPAVLVLALAIAVLPPMLSSAVPTLYPESGLWATWIYRSLVLLVISCPCALVISTPVSIVSALAAAARKGVLIKGGARLEKLAAVRCVAFDKTGTLTTGELEVSEVIGLHGAGAREVLAAAASLESRSEHPIGRAIVHRARGDGVGLLSVHGFEALPGQGAQGQVGPSRVLVGSHRLFDERHLCSPEMHAAAESLAADGRSTVMVAADDVPIGVIGVSDRVRDTARDTVALLRGQGVAHVVLLTGDHESAAGRIARALGVDEYRASLLPDDKVTAIADLRRRHGVVAMVGDGVNDAPALASADVGIAMGVAGSDAALETADVALMADDLPKIPYTLRLSRATTRNIRANIAFSLALKGLFLVMAVGGSATLWMAVVADMGASLLVVANALRLLKE